MQRLYDFLRRHPTGVDSFWAVVLLGFSSLPLVLDGVGSMHLAATVLFTLGLCLVVALRRKAPVKMLLLTAAIGVGQLIVGVKPNLSDFGMLVIAYTVASAPAAPAGPPAVPWPVPSSVPPCRSGVIRVTTASR